MVKTKRKVFDSSSSAQVYLTYDPYTYSQNFDDGLVMSHPDDSSRSFSARFAVPSRIFEKGEMVWHDQGLARFT
jgi:L-rhamnose isomerase